MKLCIVRFIRRLVAQQIPVRAGIEKRLIRLARFFADRERDGAVGILRADAPDKSIDFFIRPPAVFAALQDERAVAEAIALFAAAQNFVLRQPVARKTSVRAADAAVVAVVFAVVRKFNDAPEEHAPSKAFLRKSAGKVAGKPAVFLARVRDQAEPVFMPERLARRQGGDHALYLVHGASSDCAAETGITSAYAPSGVSIEPMTARTPK